MANLTNRRIPRQSRSQQRVDLILDTAADLFTEIGYEATTTNAIAERAQISIGSLYRYYPDKAAILHGLVNRYDEQIRAVFDQIDTPDLVYLPPEVLIDRLLDPFLNFYIRCPVYARLQLGSDISADIAGAFQLVDKETDDRITGIFRRLVPQLDEKQARIMTALCESQVKALTSLLSSNSDTAFREQITRETKRMFLAYLKTFLDTQTQ